MNAPADDALEAEVSAPTEVETAIEFALSRVAREFVAIATGFKRLETVVALIASAADTDLVAAGRFADCGTWGGVGRNLAKAVDALEDTRLATIRTEALLARTQTTLELIASAVVATK
jgi:hypothetical protein